MRVRIRILVVFYTIKKLFGWRLSLSNNNHGFMLFVVGRCSVFTGLWRKMSKYIDLSGEDLIATGDSEKIWSGGKRASLRIHRP